MAQQAEDPIDKFSRKNEIKNKLRDNDIDAHEYYSIKIHKLAQRGLLKELLAELQIHPKRLNERNSLGESVLYKACEYGQRNVVTILLGLGAEPNYSDDDAESTALMACAKNGYVDIGQMLIDRKAAINKVDEENQTALLIACKYYQKNFVKLLLKYHANVEKKDSDGHDAVMICALSNQDDILKYLLHVGAGMNTRDDEHNTPLMWACINGHRKVVRRLIDSGAEISLQNSFEWNCLMLAIMNGHIDIALFLIDHSIPLQQLSRNRSTALTMACKYGYFELAAALASRGCDLHHENYVGDTPLSIYGSAAYPPLTAVSIKEHKEKLIEIGYKWKKLEFDIRVSRAAAEEEKKIEGGNNEVVNFDGTPQEINNGSSVSGKKGRGAKLKVVQYFRKHYEYLDELKSSRGVDVDENGHAALREDTSPIKQRFLMQIENESAEIDSKNTKKVIKHDDKIVVEDL